MKKKDWNEGLNHIDEDLVEEYIAKSEEIDKKRRNKSIWLRVIAIASCFAIIVGAIFAVPMVRSDEIQKDIPTWDEPMYSAEEIARRFTSVSDSDGVTNAYQEVFINNRETWNINSIPNDKYVGVYKYQTELWQFSNTHSPRILKAFDTESIENYEISKEYLDSFTYKCGNIELHYRVSNDSYSVDFKISVNDEFWNGKLSKISSTMSAHEIERLIEPIMKKLFDLFDVSYSNVRVNISTTDNVFVYFYNESVDFPNKYNEFYPDYITLAIHPLSGWATVLFKDSNYTANEYSRIANAKKMSLEEAEELLYKGYVFGFHTCDICMRDQETISFEGYDYVGFEYVFESGGKSVYHEELCIPFYTFYKKLYVNENGATVYAKTYVPAIELSGYEEYFEVIAPTQHNG